MPDALVGADLNRDGYMDLAFTTGLQEIVGVLLSDNNGTFAIRTTLPTDYVARPQSLTTGDFNSDNLTDLALGDINDRTLTAFLSTGDGGFYNETILSDQMYPLRSITAGDFNGDHYLDIVAIGYNIGVLFGDGTGSFGPWTSIPRSILSAPTSVVTGHFNNDGQLDLAVVDRYGDNGEVLLNTGNGRFELSTTFTFASNSQPKSFAVADFNNDTRLDLAVVNNNKGNVAVLLGYGNGTFDTPKLYSTGINSAPDSVITGDFNNDGHLDLAVTIWNEQNVDILLGTGNGTFLPPLQFFTRTNSLLTALVADDFNSDRRLDLAVLDYRNRKIYILFNMCVCCVP